MIKVYININQLYNFLIYKEPVELRISSFNTDDVEVILKFNKIVINTYTTYSTIELDSFKKKIKRGWNKLWKKTK